MNSPMSPAISTPPKLHKLGLIMGTSYQSSAEYYQLINDGVNQRLGGLYCAPMAMRNLEFQQISDWMQADDWLAIASKLSAVMHGMLLDTSVEAFLICSNTLHYALWGSDVGEFPNVPLIHIGDCLAAAIKREQLNCVALLGTEFTMSKGFMRERLEKSSARVLLPNVAEQEKINSIIFDELCKGRRTKKSCDYLERLIERLIYNGARGIVLGCTELEQLIKPSVQRNLGERIRAKHPELPRLVFFESMKIHAKAAVEFCCTGQLPQV